MVSKSEFGVFWAFDWVFLRGIGVVFFGRILGLFSSPGGLLWVMTDDTQGLISSVLLAHLSHLW